MAWSVLLGLGEHKCSLLGWMVSVLLLPLQILEVRCYRSWGTWVTTEREGHTSKHGPGAAVAELSPCPAGVVQAVEEG